LVIKVKDKIMSDGPKTPEIPEEWLKRAKEQKERVRNMPDEELNKWGFNPAETLKEKQERDERENPSRK